ncbi:MAG: helix-turn-helix transcriptional regulator, partial [Ktedonobacteraceae bacterium]|nr:helix-turn-helix transcriptional regulator [Ktedonobacteraceae bacterium]
RLTAPLLFLSSEQSGWEGLSLHAFHEPVEREDWITPTTSDTSLVLFTRGAMHMGYRSFNGPWKEFNIHQGDLLLRPGGRTPYEVRWRGLSSEPAQTLHLHLDKDLLVRTAAELTGSDPSRLSLVERSAFQDPLLTQISLALWHELEQPSSSGKLYAQTAAQMLAVHLLRHYTSAEKAIREPLQGLTRRQVQRVTDFVLAHLNQDLSLEALAQQAGFSPYHFARLFRQATGESPHQFVLRQRIERAQHLLKETDMPLAHVALESGFANQSHLTRAFKRYHGLTPRAYRLDY